MGIALALALAAGPTQTEEPRILEAAAQMAAETRLQRSQSAGSSRRGVQSLPQGVKIALVSVGAVVTYVGVHHVEHSVNRALRAAWLSATPITYRLVSTPAKP